MGSEIFKYYKPAYMFNVLPFRIHAKYSKLVTLTRDFVCVSVVFMQASSSHSQHFTNCGEWFLSIQKFPLIAALSVSKCVLRHGVEIFLLVKVRMVSALCLCVQKWILSLISWFNMTKEVNILWRASVNFYFRVLWNVRVGCPWSLLPPLSCPGIRLEVLMNVREFLNIALWGELFKTLSSM
jgi:hypothetical protein